MEIVRQTGVPSKKPGDPIKSAELNSMNSTINNVVDHENCRLREFCNVNLEITGNYNILSLESAIGLIPKTRRVEGIVVRFKGNAGWEEWEFLGENWESLSSWRGIGNTVIDGGEF